MQRGLKNWWAEVTIQVEATAGPLDLVRLEVPAGLARRFEFSTDVTSHVTPLPNRRSLLEIWPTTADNNRLVEIRMRAPLDAESRDVPSLRLIDRPLAKHYLILPLRLDNQEVIWQMSHLTPAKLPVDLKLEPPQYHHVYEVTRHPFRATLSSVATANMIPRIALCDVDLEWLSDRAVGKITCWLAPPHHRFCGRRSLRLRSHRNAR